VAREFEIAFDRIKDGLERIIEHEMENTPDSIDELTILIQNEPNEFGSDAIRWAARWRAFNVYMLIALAATIATDPSTETQATEGFFEKQRKWELSAAEALREGNGKEYRSKTSFYYALWKLNSRESVTSREQFLIRSLSTEAVTADRILAVYKRLNRRLALQHHASFENLQEDGSAAFYAANRLDSDNRGSVTANNISKPTRSDAPPQGTLEWFLSSNHCKYARANQLIYNILSPQLSKAEVSSRIRLFSITAANAKISGTEAFQLLTQGVDETKRLGLNSMWAVDSAINAMNFKAGLKAVGRE
jgi:hypothetical protein